MKDRWQIGTRLTNSLNEYVGKTNKKDTSKEGKGRKPYYFRLIKKIHAKVLADTQKKTGNFSI